MIATWQVHNCGCWDLKCIRCIVALDSQAEETNANLICIYTTYNKVRVATVYGISPVQFVKLVALNASQHPEKFQIMAV